MSHQWSSATISADLCASFRAYAVDCDTTKHHDQSPLQTTINQWVQCLQRAFYSPREHVKDAPLFNKFLELEKALSHASLELSSAFEDTFWVFTVQFIITVACEPAALSSGITEAPKPPTAASSSTGKRKTAKRTERPQPHAPLAFVTLSALRKLADEQENRFRDAYRRQGRENQQLQSFCEQELLVTKVDAKLLVEIIELFCMEHFQQEQIRALAEHLLSTKNHAALVRLCQTYGKVIQWDFERMICKLIQSKDWGSAELMAKTFEHDPEQKILAKALVQEAIALQEFKRAHRIVYNFGLQVFFPDIEQLYSRDALAKLMEKQKWALALSFVGSDATLQQLLLSQLVAAHEWHYATLLARDKMGLSDFDAQKQHATLPGSSSAPSPSFLSNLAVNGHLELPISHEKDIFFCETELQIRQAAMDVFSTTSNGTETPLNELKMIGLDVEWRPTSTKIASHTGVLSTTAVASILQIATTTKVFLIDLLALHENDFLFDEFLLQLFLSDQFLKIGFGFDSDLKVLHQTFPERKAFHAVAPFLELSGVVQKAFGASVGNSLSNATARILGKPLDKRMQLSNWEDRPLSQSQQIYAALDAFCLLQITQSIQLNGLYDDHSVHTTWHDVMTQSVAQVGLSTRIDSSSAITELVGHRRDYARAWLDHRRSDGTARDGTKKALRTLTDVHQYWNERVQQASEASGQPPTPETTKAEAPQIQVVPVDQLQSLLALSLAHEQPRHRHRYVAVNSICFFADDKPCVACIDANAKLDTSRLASLCGLSRRKIKLATAMECESLWGFSPGTVAPFGFHCQEEMPRLFVDVTLQEYDYWLTGSGAFGKLLVVACGAFFKYITIHSVADIALHRNNNAFNNNGSRPTTDSTPGTALGSSTTTPTLDSTITTTEYKFLADTMVGRVGRWLRTIGIDVVLWESNPPSSSSAPVVDTASGPVAMDRKSALLHLAAQEQRIVLTRDKKLADRRDAGACFVVSSDDPKVQFQEIKSHFAIQLVKEEMMTRCAKCNFKGFEIVDREYVATQMKDVVHEGVLNIVDTFWKCLACHKIYWVGPKYSSAYENMMQKFEDI